MLDEEIETVVIRGAFFLLRELGVDDVFGQVAELSGGIHASGGAGGTLTCASCKERRAHLGLAVTELDVTDFVPDDAQHLIVGEGVEQP